MTQPRMELFLARLGAEYPQYPLSVRPYQSPDDETVEFFIDILLVPETQLHEVGMRAWVLADEVYGDTPVPFLMTSVSPESSIEYFADELANTRPDLAVDFLVEGLSRIELDPAWFPVASETETLLASTVESPFQWGKSDPGPYAAWLSVVQTLVAAGPAETALFAPNPGSLSTSVGPDSVGNNFSLAA